MKYNVNGLTFSHEDLDSKIILPNIGEVSGAFYFFIPKKSSNVFTLLKPGQYLSKEVVDKISGNQIFSMSVINADLCEQIKMSLEILKKSNNEMERLKVGKEFLEILSRQLDDSFKSSVSLFKILFEIFYEINPKIAYLLDKKSEILFQRSLVVAGFSVIHSIKTGIVDFEFIKRTYNVLFCLDIGLVLDGELTSNTLIACELERKQSGDGQAFIKKSSSKEETLFLTHPQRGLAFLNRTLEDDHYKSIIEVVGTHHESGNVYGFPKGFSRCELTRFENIVMECDQLVSFSENLFESNEILSVFQMNLCISKEVA